MPDSIGLFLSLIQAVPPEGNSLGDLVWRASPIAKGVLLLLLVFSVLSWAIIFTKYLALKQAQNSTNKFLARFRQQVPLPELYREASSFKESPLARVFLAGYAELAKQPALTGASDRRLDAVSRVLQSATIGEVTRLEQSLSWLATTANASPFIGLFGTVVGIIIAFHGLSTATTSSVQAVAPGIAEALIATAAGIAAAVPAAIFYNFFLNQIKILTADMDRFSLELLNLVEQERVPADLLQA